MGRRSHPRVLAPRRARIVDLDRDGRGVARVEGKVVFVDRALPGDEVRFATRRRRPSFDEGTVSDLLVGSPDRARPRCPYFDRCGGCTLQHQAQAAQLRVKQARMVQALERLGGVVPATLFAPLARSPWGYRRKARLAARYVARKGGVLVGFRERHGSYVADLGGCEVLVPEAGRLLPALRAVLSALSIPDRLPQVELAAGDGQLALVLRHLAPLGDADRRLLVDFARREGVVVYLQPAGLDSVRPLWPEAPPSLGYSLPAFDVEIRFQPTDFVQVNGPVNEALVARVVELLSLGGRERVLDLFCGLGNFTLPLARRAAEVTGVEGSAELVERARDNARRNGLPRASFEAADLLQAGAGAPWWGRPWDRVVLDPPRAGAFDLLRAMRAPFAARLVYVSCQAETLARDAGVLVHEHGYRLAGAGVVDMFPHTNHVETVALFTRG